MTQICVGKVNYVSIKIFVYENKNHHGVEKFSRICSSEIFLNDLIWRSWVQKI